MHACQCVCQWSRYAFAVLLLYKIKHTCETNMIPYSDHNRWDTAIAIAEMCTLRNTNANFSIATAASSMHIKHKFQKQAQHMGQLLSLH